MPNRSSIYDCVIRELPLIHNRSGNITPVSANVHLPFNIERIYYLYDIPGGSIRGGHAHKQMHQLIVAASGSFDVLIDDGINRKVVNLNRPYIGLYIIPGIWRELVNFSSGAICLVLASTQYDESDYIREYRQFKEMYNGN